MFSQGTSVDVLGKKKLGKNENFTGKVLPYCRISFSWHAGQETCMIHYPDHSIEMYVVLTFCQCLVLLLLIQGYYICTC